MRGITVRFWLFIGAILAAAPAAGGNLGSAPAAIDQHALFRIVGYFYNVDPDLLQAIAAIESGGDSRAVSPAGAQGLMQLMPGTGRQFGVENPFDAVDNVFGAVRYLDYLRRWESVRPGSNLSMAEVLAAYNAGEGAVEKYQGIPPYSETQEYVRRVIIAYLLAALVQRPAPIMYSHGLPANLVRARSKRDVARLVLKPKSLPVVDVFDQLAEIRKARAQAISRQSGSSKLKTK